MTKKIVMDDDEMIYLTVRYLPDEILAVRTEGGLLEEPRYEVVILDFEHVLLLERPLPPPEPDELLEALLHAVLVVHPVDFGPNQSATTPYLSIRVVFKNYVLISTCYRIAPLRTQFPPATPWTRCSNSGGGGGW